MGPKRKRCNKIELAPTHLAGSVFTKICFSHDSRYLFCGYGSVIKVFNTINGECLHDLKGHSSVVTGIAVNSSNVLQIYSCGLDGLLVSWDYLDGAKLKQQLFPMPLYGIISIDPKTEAIIMIAKSAQKYSLLQWSRDRDSLNEFAKPKVLIQHCNKDQELVSMGCMNQFVASAQGSQLTVYDMKREITNLLSDKDKYNRDKNFTSIACHPTEYCIATGIENGRIIFWYNFFNDKNQQTSTVHWHSLAVLTLNFTPDGSILLSGGHECVFVRWQINNQYQKDFKPRMGAPLTRVLSSPDGNHFVTLHADNVIQVMDINLSVLHVHRGMTRAFWNIDPDTNPILAGLSYDQRSRSIITNGLPGHLQFYSLPLQKQLYNLDIVGQNYISPENLDQPTVVTEVKRSAISADGQWLASFEMWDDGFFTPELRLKFWEYSTSQQTYVLNTVVESPHELEINSMCFRPPLPTSSKLRANPTLVTTGMDRCFKLWTLVDDTDIYRANTRWDCDSMGFYKDMQTSTADFSCDGSSLAVGFERLLTIWDPEDNVVRKTLCPSESGQDQGMVRTVKFGCGDSRYFLMSLSDTCLTSWNLLTLTVAWSMDIKSSVLVGDPTSDLMAIISLDSTLTMFRPKSSELVYQKEKVTDSKVLAAVFVPNNRPTDVCGVGWPGESQIYFYTASLELITLDRSDRIEHTDKVQIHQQLPQWSLSAIMAEKVVRGHDDTQRKETQGKVHPTQDFISTMLHTNQPVSTFCAQFLDTLLVKKKSKSRSKRRKEVEEEEEEDMAVSGGVEEEEVRPTQVFEDLALVEYLREDREKKQLDSKELDRLVSKPEDWVQWCASLSLNK